jgi:Na+-translocating ferredoxin:NAD+ oxidoreductase RnfD subunit
VTVLSWPAPGLSRQAQRFFRTPKGILLLVLGGITLLALPGQGASVAGPGVLSAMAAAAVTDVAIIRLSRNTWSFPSGALLTGLIVAMVLSPQEPWIVPIATSILAVTSKHLWRTRLANVFNPAALALVLAAVFFDSGHSWWGALPDLGWVGLPVLLLAGWYIADRVNKVPLVLVFLGTYFLLFTVASFVGDAVKVSEIFRSPDLHAVLFFAFFMVDDPPTCPVRYRDQVVFGAVVAFVCYTMFQLFGWLYFLPAGLLVGNAGEGLRRSLARARARRQAAQPPASHDWRRAP